MPRARKRHVQQELRYRDKNGQRRGGKRKGAGRPKSGVFASQPHKRRPRLKASEPVQVTTLLPGDSGTGSADLERGDYKMLCTVANHEELGMSGRLVVR